MSEKKKIIIVDNTSWKHALQKFAVFPSHMHMVKMVEEMITLSTLGRSFELGMLYDRRRDELLPGLSLWGKEKLESNIRITPKPNTEYDIVAEDTFESKATALDIEASLKLSFLGGLISVEGSAKYLDDRKSSRHQSRITLNYKTTSEFKQLTMEHLGRGHVEYPYVFEEKDATHVVVAILYGANAFFIFDRTISSEENEKEVNGEVKAMVKAFPSFQIEGQAKVKMSEEQRAKANKLHVKFHGDFHLDSNPTTFEEAVAIYQNLPKRTGNMVPVKVWLYPLTKLDSNAARMVREISADLVTKTSKILESFHEVNMTCADLLSSPVCNILPTVNDNLKEFLALNERYQVQFKGKLLPLLPKIRGGGLEEKQLVDVLTHHNSTLFSEYETTKWLEQYKTEITIFQAYMQLLSGVEHVKESGALDRELILNPDVACFEFHYNSAASVGLVARKREIEGSYAEAKLVQDSCTPWYRSEEIKNQIRESVYNFQAFMKHNPRESSSIRFISTTIEDENKPTGCSIALYKEYKKVQEDFVPPSKPENLTIVDTGPTLIYLSWTKPAGDEKFIRFYNVRYREIGTGQHEWSDHKVRHTVKETVVTGLKMNTAYNLLIEGVCDIGKTEPSNDVTATTQQWTPADNKPLYYPLTSSMNVGKALKITLKPRTVSSVDLINCFSIRLQEEKQMNEASFVFYIQSKRGKLELNTNSSLKGWVTTKATTYFPYEGNTDIVIEITCEQEQFKVSIDRKEHGKFSYNGLKLGELNSFEVSGDIESVSNVDI